MVASLREFSQEIEIDLMTKLVRRSIIRETETRSVHLQDSLEHISAA